MQTNSTTNRGFKKGNPYAAMGGRARAQRLDASRRKAIAQSGWRARVRRQFNGDEQAAKDYVAELGRWAGDPYDGNPVPRKYFHPGPVNEWLAKRYTLPLWEAMTNTEKARYNRAPQHDRRFGRGDDWAGDAWEDTETGRIVYGAVGYRPGAHDDENLREMRS